MKGPGLTANDIYEVLRTTRYAAPAWAIFREVRNGTGFARKVTRSADALAMSLWPGRGLEVHGIEIKVHRGDWLAELANPEKADETQKYCDKWYVATPKGLIKPGELPKNWGHIEVLTSNALRTKDAPSLKATPLDRLFIASILRSQHKQLEKQYKSGQMEGYDRGKKEGPTDLRHELDAALANELRLKQAIAEFEEKSGVQLDQWNAGRVGDAVKIVLQHMWGHRVSPQQSLKNLMTYLDNLKESVAKEMKTLEAIDNEIKKARKSNGVQRESNSGLDRTERGEADDV